MVNNALSRGLGNIAKVYLMKCGQSTCAELKKFEFCPVGHGGIAHIMSYQFKLMKMRAELADLITARYPFKAAPPSTCAGTIICSKYKLYTVT